MMIAGQETFISCMCFLSTSSSFDKRIMIISKAFGWHERQILSVYGMGCTFHMILHLSCFQFRRNFPDEARRRLDVFFVHNPETRAVRYVDHSGCSSLTDAFGLSGCPSHLASEISLASFPGIHHIP